jgi:hypothetical protein
VEYIKLDPLFRWYLSSLFYNTKLISFQSTTSSSLPNQNPKLATNMSNTQKLVLAIGGTGAQGTPVVKGQHRFPLF